MEYQWHGFKGEQFEFEGRPAYVVFPDDRDLHRLAIKAEYWDAFPAEEIELLRRGYTLAFNTNRDRWGSDESLECKARFARQTCARYGLSPKCALIGMSCGGLIAIKFAARYPELVSAMYIDAPVVDLLSCPGRMGVNAGVADDSTLREMLDALGMASASELLSYRGHPLDCLPQLTASRIPAILVAGECDMDVPYCENGLLIERAYAGTGIPFEAHLTPGRGHHPHGLEPVGTVAAFLAANG